MMQHNQDWDLLGRNIQDIVERAVNARDYHRLNQTIRQVVGKAVDLGGEAVRRTRDVNAVPPTIRQEPVQPRPLPVLYGNTGSRTTAGVLKIVGGSILSAFSGMLMLSLMVLDWLLFDVGFFPLAWGGIGAGVLLIVSGVRTLGKVKRFKTYCKTLGQKTHCTLEALARSVGKNVKFVRREVERMIREGLFLQGHLDKEETRLITSDETYRQFEHSRLQLEQRQREEAARQQQRESRTYSPQVQDVLDRGSAFVAQIRRCNDDIPGEAVSAKIDRMEMIVRRIFERAEAHPEIVPDLKKLMDHYLPMTVKLLNAYADMDAQPIQGQTIQSSKREIEDTLDTLNLAYEKLLDSVFADTALDVSSDISVLNTMLAQEGLTEDALAKMRKERNL
ncbi:MAG: 5-bromo-4-chloroindolyl phosphate hydrolysis family protein [Oscillospiraceae bacterium]|nr:5-bromo-4-chloroindolyl phosphate hydrolysis family protein [Oscillospiraceae bacterium]